MLSDPFSKQNALFIPDERASNFTTRTHHSELNAQFPDGQTLNERQLKHIEISVIPGNLPCSGEIRSAFRKDQNR